MSSPGRTYGGAAGRSGGATLKLAADRWCSLALEQRLERLISSTKDPADLACALADVQAHFSNGPMDVVSRLADLSPFLTFGSLAVGTGALETSTVHTALSDAVKAQCNLLVSTAAKAANSAATDCAELDKKENMLKVRLAVATLKEVASTTMCDGELKLLLLKQLRRVPVPADDGSTVSDSSVGHSPVSPQPRQQHRQQTFRLAGISEDCDGDLALCGLARDRFVGCSKEILLARQEQALGGKMSAAELTWAVFSRLSQAVTFADALIRRSCAGGEWCSELYARLLNASCLSHLLQILGASDAGGGPAGASDDKVGGGGAGSGRGGGGAVAIRPCPAAVICMQHMAQAAADESLAAGGAVGGEDGEADDGGGEGGGGRSCAAAAARPFRGPGRFMDKLARSFRTFDFIVDSSAAASAHADASGAEASSAGRRAQQAAAAGASALLVDVVALGLVSVACSALVVGGCSAKCIAAHVPHPAPTCPEATEARHSRTGRHGSQDGADEEPPRPRAQEEERERAPAQPEERSATAALRVGFERVGDSGRLRAAAAAAGAGAAPSSILKPPSTGGDSPASSAASLRLKIQRHTAAAQQGAPRERTGSSESQEALAQANKMINKYVVRAPRGRYEDRAGRPASAVSDGSFSSRGRRKE